jgi:hypothetical protein
MADTASAATDERRAQQQAKRLKLFHAMRDSASADVLPALQECNYPQFYQFALAMEHMLQTWALERGGSGAEDTRAAALAVLSGGEGRFAAEVRAAVEADAAHKAWPWRTSLTALETEEPLVERVVAFAGMSGVGGDLAVPGAPCHRLRIVGPYARTCLVEVGWDFADPARVVQRDSVYQSLVFLLGLLSRHPLLSEAASGDAARALIQRKRELARASLESGVARHFQTERAEARAEVARTRVELELLRGDGAEAERAQAEAGVQEASAEVERCVRELEQARHDAATRFVEAEAATRAEWLALCGERQQFWTRELNRSREREEAAQARVLAARARVDEAAQRIERLEERLWSTTTCPFARGGDAPATLQDHLEVTQAAMVEVDAYLDAFVPLTAWADARREHMETLRAWIQHEAVVLDGHRVAVRRSEAMLRPS